MYVSLVRSDVGLTRRGKPLMAGWVVKIESVCRTNKLSNHTTHKGEKDINRCAIKQKVSLAMCEDEI